MYKDLKETEHSFAACMVRAITEVFGITQQEVLENLKNSSVEVGVLPYIIECVETLLNKYGFYKKSAVALTRGTKEDIISYMNKKYEKDLIVIAYGYNGYKIIRYNKEIDSFDYDGEDNFYDCKLYFRWDNDEKQLENAKRKVKVQQRVKTSYLGETYSYNYYQPNPNDNNVGDCVLRAYSAALDISWEEAMEQLLSQGSTLVNCESVYPKALEANGFVEVTSRYNQNKNLHVEEFCCILNETHSDRRFFVIVNRHAIAITPTKCEDGTYRYKVQDTWNSTTKKIQRIWANIPQEESFHKRTQRKKEEKSKKLTQLNVGDKIIHPDFGEGEITEITSDNKICTIEFGSNNIKKLSSIWIKNKCTAK